MRSPRSVERTSVDASIPDEIADGAAEGGIVTERKNDIDDVVNIERRAGLEIGGGVTRQ